MRAFACLITTMSVLSAALLLGPASADAESPSPPQQEEALASALVIRGVEALDGGQQLQFQRDAQLESPSAVNARAASRSRFEGLAGGESVALARRTFGIEHPAWISPGSGGEGKITKYLGEEKAVEVTKSGQKLLVSSTIPLRSAIGSGRMAPLSFSLQDHGRAYVPANPLVPVSIAKTAAAGVSLPLGISFAPSQAAAPESSVVVGGSVVYPRTTVDTDFVVEPTPSGVEASWQLLSEDSPEENSLRFSLPAGASLQLSKKEPGGAEIVREGQALAVIPPAVATEADGSLLEASYSVEGDTLTTHVDLAGSVAFPVLVDPAVAPMIGWYGVDNGADGWALWQSADNCGGCMGHEIGQEFLKTSASSGTPSGVTGQWYVYAPGAGQPGGAGITRVDLGGVKYFGTEQTFLSAEIGLSSGSTPIWTNNGFYGALENSPLVAQGPVSESLAFCAQEAGGHDGLTPGLCSESYSGPYFTMQLTTFATTKAFSYYKFTAAAVYYVDETPPDEAHIYNVPSGWHKQGPASSVFIKGHDQGVGVQSLVLEIPPEHVNEKGEPFYALQSGCSNQKDFAGCPEAMQSPTIDLSGLPTGGYELGGYAYDAVGRFRIYEPDPTNNPGHGPLMFIDSTPPVIAPLGGALSEHESGTIGAGSFPLVFSAQDGSDASLATAQSGVRTFKVSVDGKQVAEMSTSCPEPTGIPGSGCFSFSGSWTMEGERFGAGTHTVTVKARDWAGNESSRSMTVTVNEADREPVGPGSVNLTTGDYKLSATDVSIAAPGGDLTVGRTYDSSEGAFGGPLGPQWSLDLPEEASDGVWRSLMPMPNGSVQLTAVTGQAVTFAASGETTFASPAGYQTLELVRTSATPREYQLNDSAGNAVIFRRPGSEEESAPLVPAVVEQARGAGGLNKVSYVFTRTAAGVTEPTKIIAPSPPGLNCTAALVEGCRELEFKYATATTASGQSKAQWGDHEGNLKEILFIAWSAPGSKQTIPVAHYSYDSQGRLRAAWNPENPLMTYYGWDEYSHLTAVTAPGQETWALTYGSSPTDKAKIPGRFLKAFQAPAATPLWTGETPSNTAEPAITGSTAVGVRLAASKGTWSGSPVTFGYTWLACNVGSGVCERVPGANGPNFTPTSSQVGFAIKVRVEATNGAGTVWANSSPVGPVKGTASGEVVEGALLAPSPGSTVEYNVPLSGSGLETMTATGVGRWAQGPDVPMEATAIFPPDEPESWPAGDYRRASIFYLDLSGHAVNVATPGGGVSTQEYDGHDNSTRSLSADSRALALSEGAKSSEAAKPLYFERKYNTLATEQLETLGPEHKVKLPSGSEVSARKFVKYTYNEEGAPAGGPYRLPTETTEAALTAGKQEDLRTVTNSYSGQEGLGWKLHAPTTTTIDPAGMHVTHSATYSQATGAETETAMPGAAANETGFPVYFKAIGSVGGGTGQLSDPNAVAIDPSGDVWVADTGNSRVDEYSPTGTFLQTFGWGVLNGKAELQLCKTSCKSGITGAGQGQLSGPPGIAYNPTNADVYVSDGANNRIEVYTTAGAWVRTIGEAGKGNGQLSSPHGLTVEPSGAVVVADQSNSRIERFSATGVFEAAYGKEGKGNAEFSGTGDVTICGGFLYVTDFGGQRVEKLTTGGTWTRSFGSAGSGNGQFTQISRIACDPLNNTVLVTDKGGNRVEVFDSSGTFIEAFGATGSGAGQLNTPIGIALNATGSVYVVDNVNSRIQQWIPSISGNTGAFKSQTIFYTPKTEASVAVCQNHPEWAGMPCQVQPAHQPESTGVPAMPITNFSYNVYDEQTITKTANGTETRTQTNGYDPAGRLTSKEVASTTGEALPKITYKYSPSTGLLIEQGAEEKLISEKYNNLAQLTTYTDADGASTTYEYEKEGDYRLLKASDPKGNQTLAYDTTTGLPTSVKDSAAGTFTAGYDVEGNRTSETLPGGLKQTVALNSVGEAVGLKYVKETHCTTSCEWFKETVVPSIHGQWMSQTSTNEADKYAYNGAGWLTETQDTPTGKACAARLYGYDADGNRNQLTKRTCGAEGGERERHAYDTADRLIDPGTTYNPFDDITSVPAADSEGATLSSKYYADGQLSSQEQSSQTVGYALDPARRTRETVSVGHSTGDVTSHYDGPGTIPSWTTAISGETTRNIAGLSGGLQALQHGTSTPELQIANLHGDVIGTMPALETATGITTAPNTTEYGVPTVTEPPPHSWLGSDGLTSELSSGAMDMGARSYVPQLGRFLQPDPQPGGSVNSYAYTSNDPINESDPSGEWSLNQGSGGISAAEAGEGQGTPGGVGIAASAVILPPPDVQAEEALAEYLASDTITAGETPAEVSRIDLRQYYLGAATGGPSNQKHRHGSANEGGTGPCRSGGKIVNGKCQPTAPSGGGDFCEATALVTISPTLWTPQGWAALAAAEAMCKLTKATHQ